jgi:hypothetical protein
VTTPGVIPIHIDITDPWCVEAAAAIANDVTLLINNAGIASSATLLGGSIDDVRAPMESHFFGTLSVTRASAPHLIANAPWAVLNVVSVLCWLHPSMLGAYAATKTALWAQTDVVREEFERRRLGDGPAHRIHGYRHGREYRRRESGPRHHRRHSVGWYPCEGCTCTGKRRSDLLRRASGLSGSPYGCLLPPVVAALSVAERESFSQITRIHARAVEPRRRTA